MSFVSFSWFWPPSFPGCHVCSPSTTPPHLPLSFSRPLYTEACWDFTQPTHSLLIKSATHINTHIHIFMHLAIPWHLAAQQVAFACLSAPPPKHTQSSSSITLSAARLRLASSALGPPYWADPTERDHTRWETATLCQLWKEVVWLICKSTFMDLSLKISKDCYRGFN